MQRDPNTTDDAVLLAAALPELAERSDVDERHTDGGDNRQIGRASCRERV